MSTDRIEKTVVLRAPLARVWRAIANAEEFGAWFGVALKGEFRAGQSIGAKLTVAGYDHLTLTMDVVSIEPQRLFSFRWHPHAVDPKHDYSNEEKTLVELALREVAGGTELTIVESGFDKLPLERRAKAFSSNGEGWGIQAKQIERYVTA